MGGRNVQGYRWAKGEGPREPNEQGRFDGGRPPAASVRLHADHSIIVPAAEHTPAKIARP